jgi:drug/metabolite transporter (DMT)-like permease
MTQPVEDIDTRGTRAGTQQIAGVGMVLVSAVLLAAMPSLAKLALDSGASVLFVMLGRFSVSVLLLAFTLLAFKRGYLPSVRVILLCVLAGIATAIMSFSFLSALRSIDISLTILIFYIHPVVVAWLGHLRGRYALTHLRLFFCALTLVGLALALSIRIEHVALSGIALASLSALGAAVLILANGDAVVEAGSTVVNFYTSVVALVLVGIASLATFGLIGPTTAVGWFGIAGAGSTYCLGIGLFLAAIPAIGLVRATLITVLEPLMGILLAMALFGAQLEWLQWLGVATVVVGLFMLELPTELLGKIIRRTPPTP